MEERVRRCTEERAAERVRIMGIDPGTNYMGYGIIEVRDGKPEAVIMGDIDLHKISDAH